MMSSQASIYSYKEKMIFLKQHNQIPQEEILEQTYQRTLNNLLETKKNIDFNKINEIIDIMDASNDVTFIGDEHDLDELYVLQLSLLTSGKPAYLFRVNETKEIHSNYLTDKSTLVIVNVADAFFHFQDILNKVKEVKGKIIYISQDYNEEISKDCDITYIYGIPQSYNYGYTSLTFLGQLFHNLYINR